MIHRSCIGMLGVLTLLACQNQTSQERTPTVAKVNDRGITLTYFESALARMARIPGMDVSRDKGRFDILKDLIDEELLYQDALKRKLYLTDPEVKTALARAMVKTQLQAQAQMPVEDLRRHFEEQKRALEKVHAAHILIKPQDPSSDEHKQKARKTAENLRDQLEKDPSRFSELAQKYSQDEANRDKGGDLGWFNRDQMVEPFSEAAFALTKPLELSPVIETSFGFHIIQLIDSRLGFEANQAALIQSLGASQGRQAFEAYLKDLQGKADIHVNQEMVKAAKVPALIP